MPGSRPIIPTIGPIVTTSSATTVHSVPSSVVAAKSRSS